MTEYEEITQNYNIKDCEREIDFQINNLGYLITDSFPQFLTDLINELKTNESNFKLLPSKKTTDYWSNKSNSLNIKK